MRKLARSLAREWVLPPVAPSDRKKSRSREEKDSSNHNRKIRTLRAKENPHRQSSLTSRCIRRTVHCARLAIPTNQLCRVAIQGRRGIETFHCQGPNLSGRVCYRKLPWKPRLAICGDLRTGLHADDEHCRGIACVLRCQDLQGKLLRGRTGIRDIYWTERLLDASCTIQYSIARFDPVPFG